MKYIFTNIGSGNGPYLRTIDMGIELKKILKGKLNEDFSILVPWVYGERQVNIIKEEFNDSLLKDRNIILLDEYLGHQFKKVLFDGRNYDIVMQELISSYSEVEKNIQNYFKKEFIVKNIFGEEVKVNGKDVIIEVSRNPNIATNIKYSYYTSIGYFEKIIQESIKNPELKLNKALLKKVLPIAKKIESYQRIYFQPEPNCFSYEEESKPFKKNEIKCPPLFQPPNKNKKKISEGFYLLVSGIPHLSEIYKYSKKIKQKVYINHVIEGFNEAQREHPNIISNKNIKFVLARAGWNTIWLSNLSKKPLICLDYIQGDFPEIYFNILSIKKRRLGTIYKKDDDIEKTIEESKSFIPVVTQFYENIKRKYGTLNGIKYSCNIIAEDLLKKYTNS